MSYHDKEMRLGRLTVTFSISTHDWALPLMSEPTSEAITLVAMLIFFAWVAWLDSERRNR